jgi:hypothetical protein
VYLMSLHLMGVSYKRYLTGVYIIGVHFMDVQRFRAFSPKFRADFPALHV